MGSGMTCVKPESGRVSGEDVRHVYHERQVKELCALHALNNLMQDKVFSKAYLDELCFKLSPENWINPHRSVLGFGNYDINIIMAALQSQGYETVWFDKRKDVKSMQLEHIHGFILNIPTEYKWGIIRLPIHRKHWISVCSVQGKYYNLDSKLDKPEHIGRAKELCDYLRKALASKDKELFVVIREDVSHDALWQHDKVPKSGSKDTLKSGRDSCVRKPVKKSSHKSRSSTPRSTTSSSLSDSDKSQGLRKHCDGEETRHCVIQQTSHTSEPTNDIPISSEKTGSLSVETVPQDPALAAISPDKPMSDTQGQGQPMQTINQDFIENTV